MARAFQRGGPAAKSAAGEEGSRGGPASRTVDLSLQRAGAGLIVAACVQVTVCVVVTHSGYPSAFDTVVFPVFLAVASAGVAALWASRTPATWSATLCVLFAAFSVAATWGIRGHYTGGLNVAEPLVGFGVFGAGMSASRLPRLAAAALIAVHRGALILAGTGVPGEHAQLALLECGSLLSAIIGSALIRRYASRLDVTEAALTAEAAFDASASMRNAASRERNRLLHDAPVNRLWQIARNLAADSDGFRLACARDADLLRGRVELLEPEHDLAAALDALTRDFGALGLRVRLAHGNAAAYPADPIVITALKRSVEQSLVNVFEHSGRYDADVTVTTQAPAVRVEVRDHGRGFATDDVAGDRLGATTSITQRMRDAGGDASIDSQAHHGTAVTMWWPR
ncbi:MAG TPA: ATP-binding protein [Trebonia sp.]|nr:ATP-binding protein [Trebonia sp.]